ncbi:MAG: hypothetical protein BAJALOKI1v1_700016 [Promethearchaeota archaeon]|nr:MAG: hypothetical protein BAJALOKI1v1_700016 [Candidatus Lokiarchaeota archaeon]
MVLKFYLLNCYEIFTSVVYSVCEKSIHYFISEQTKPSGVVAN